MKVTRISAAGVIEDTGEVLPDREQLTSKMTDVCRKTGRALCSSNDLCKPCEQALERILARLGPVRTYSEDEVEETRIRSRKGRHG